MKAAAAITDENSNAQVGVVAAELATLARKTGVALLLVHHTGKASAGAPGSQHAARGASALACRSRWIMQLSPRGSEDDTGSQPLIEARIVKDSYHVPTNPWSSNAVKAAHYARSKAGNPATRPYARPPCHGSSRTPIGWYRQSAYAVESAAARTPTWL